jgi:hypothetical protein
MESSLSMKHVLLQNDATIGITDTNISKLSDCGCQVTTNAKDSKYISQFWALQRAIQ